MLLAARLREMAGEGLRDVRPRSLLAQALAAALPQLTFNRSRTAILRAGGFKIGPRSLVMGPIRVTGKGDPKTLFAIGSDSQVTGPLHVDLGAPIRIGHHVFIGHDVALLTMDYWTGPADDRYRTGDVSAIVIEDGVWIGSRVTVLSGVRMGAGAVVAAGAVVTSHVPRDTLVAGVPAVVIRELGPGISPDTRLQSTGGGEGADGPLRSP
jgi:carbonic anhydrase/acetyltransferase-like protein (isoleucine patch superfamily)